MDPLVQKIARAVLEERGHSPDALIRVGSSDKYVPYWTMQVEYVERLRIALRMLAAADGEPRPRRDPGTSYAELLKKISEAAGCTRPASAGDVADLGKKLDEIAGLLRSALSAHADEADAIKSLVARLLSRSA